jgi:hypothetical protein
MKYPIAGESFVSPLLHSIANKGISFFRFYSDDPVYPGLNKQDDRAWKDPEERGSESFFRPVLVRRQIPFLQEDPVKSGE